MFRLRHGSSEESSGTSWLRTVTLFTLRGWMLSVALVAYPRSHSFRPTSSSHSHTSQPGHTVFHNIVAHQVGVYFAPAGSAPAASPTSTECVDKTFCMAFVQNMLSSYDYQGTHTLHTTPTHIQQGWVGASVQGHKHRVRAY